MTQPKALRLANDLDKYGLGVVAYSAAAELRRLHEVNQELVEALKALDECRGPFTASDAEINRAWKMVHAALEKARGTE